MDMLSNFPKFLRLKYVLLVGITLGAVIPAALFAAVEQWSSQSALEKQLTSDLDRLGRVLSLSLQEPMWQIADEQVAGLLDAAMADPRIDSISVFDGGARPYLERRRETAPLGRLYSTTRDVMRGGNQLGTVAISISDHIDDQANREKLLELLLNVVVASMLTVLIAWTVLHFLLTRPVRKIVMGAERLQNGDLESPVGNVRGVELQTVASALERLRLALRESSRRTEEARQKLIETNAVLQKQLVAVEEANMAKAEFLATMSHELRTPLNAVIGFSELIAGQHLGPISPPKYMQYGYDIQQSGKHLLSIIDDILFMVRLDKGSAPLNLSTVDPRNVVAAAVAQLRPLAEAKAQNLTLDVPEANAPIVSDERALLQIFLNVVSNAIKYTGEGGRIAVLGKALPDGGWEFSVSDNGRGIPAESLANIGEPFHRVGRPHISDQGGVGLGLSITHGLLRKLGGAFSIVSEIGRGTRIDIALPSAPEKGLRSDGPEP